MSPCPGGPGGQGDFHEEMTFELRREGEQGVGGRPASRRESSEFRGNLFALVKELGDVQGS